MLTYPKNGDNVLKWAREATREINSNHIQNGIGVKVTRTPNGTNLIVKSENATTSGSISKMPFDGSLSEHTGDSSSAVIKVLKGSLFYVLAGEVAEVPHANLTDDYWNVSVTLYDGLTIGIVCDYSSNAGGTGPVSFHVDVIPNASTTDTAWTGPNGLLYYPLIRFVDGTTGYDGPSIFSVSYSSGGTSTTLYAVQCHHGDVVYYHNNDYPYVARITASGDGGRYSVSPVSETASSSSYVYVVEIAGTATIPVNSRVVAHTVYSEILGSGSTSSS